MKKTTFFLMAAFILAITSTQLHAEYATCYGAADSNNMQSCTAYCASLGMEHTFTKEAGRCGSGYVCRCVQASSTDT